MVVTLTPLPDIPMVRPGDDLAGLLIAACERSSLAPLDGDVFVVAQKIVSKAEGRYVDLAKVQPSQRARSLAAEVSKDPRLVEVILGESRRVVRHRPGVLIVEHRLGFIMANAGVDRSNVDPAAGAEPVLLLPRDPDALRPPACSRASPHISARRSASSSPTAGDGRGGAAPSASRSVPPAFRRSWIMRGRPDLFGHALRVTQTGFADEIASAASLLMGQADEARPAVLVRGLVLVGSAGAGRDA